MFLSPFNDSIYFQGSNVLNETLITPSTLEMSNNFSAKRKREFLLGRSLAATGLTRFGCAPTLQIDPSGRPAWPNGYIGSITHKGDWAFCAIAPSTVAKGLGIDLEIIIPNKDFVDRISLPSEKLWISAGNSQFKQFALFSAKEALFKCLFPATNTFFGFKDAELVFNSGGFTATLLRELGTVPLGTKVRISLDSVDNYILTSAIFA